MDLTILSLSPLMTCQPQSVYTSKTLGPKVKLKRTVVLLGERKPRIGKCISADILSTGNRTGFEINSFRKGTHRNSF